MSEYIGGIVMTVLFFLTLIIGTIINSEEDEKWNGK